MKLLLLPRDTWHGKCRALGPICNATRSRQLLLNTPASFDVKMRHIARMMRGRSRASPRPRDKKYGSTARSEEL